LMSVVLYHPDVHGGLSGLIALKAFEARGIRVVHHFGGSGDEPPSTEPGVLPETLRMFVDRFSPSSIFILDVPVDAENPGRLLAALEYASGVARVEYVVHDEVPEEIRFAVDPFRHGRLRVNRSAYRVSLHVPLLLDVPVGGDLDCFALIGAVIEGDDTVSGRVSKELEYEVNMHLASAWRTGFASIEEVKKLAPRYGGAGAIVEHLLRRNAGCEELLQLAREYGGELKPVDHEVRGGVAKEAPPQGFALTTAWLLTWVTGAPVAVLKSVSRGRIEVVVYVYWRNKFWLGEPVDEALRCAVRCATRGRPRPRILGYVGTRIIPAPSSEDADRLIEVLVDEINEALPSFYRTPRRAKQQIQQPEEPGEEEEEEEDEDSEDFEIVLEQ